MPSLSALVDNFNDGVIGPDWGNSYGGVTETGGRARVPCTTGFAGLQTAYSWTMAGASLFVKVASVPAASTATEAYCGVLVNGDASGTRIGFTIKAVGNLLRMQNDTGYFDATAVEITYDPVNHAFLRLREDGTNVYWDTSPDGSTWTNQRTLASPAWIATALDVCALDLSAHRDAGTADYAEYDLFNTLSDGAVYTATGTGSAQSSATITGTYIGQGNGSAAGAGTATATGTAVYRGSGSGSAQSGAQATSEDPRIREVAGMPAGTYTLVVEQGATLVRTITCDIDDPAFTWDGWTPRAQIRTAAAESGELLLDLTPYLSVDGPAITLLVPATVTQTVTRSGRWDLELAKDGTVVRLLQGPAELSPEVTR
jgi:hypothetical protein